MPRYRLLSVFLISFLISSCGKPIPALKGIDLTIWKEDRNACGSRRTVMLAAMEVEKEKLKALSELDIVKLLGRPDENQLLDRNQKIYTYYLEAGPTCPQPKADARKLILRINAMGRAKETLIK